uniref:Toxin-antitoxin system HicB family antitoxin n=1 Tax=uncultured Thiotrichaceae bacterium TaxID=298394 RepID=A0A6S6T951_9GAMM|nr:MAG: conserved hypothetical protein [uncultured Thiotrichaceae bacterium]
MKQTATYPLRLPKSLKEAVGAAASRDGTSINQFIAIAVAEKLAVLDTERFFDERRQHGEQSALRDMLTRTGGETPRAGDELS